MERIIASVRAVQHASDRPPNLCLTLIRPIGNLTALKVPRLRNRQRVTFD